jgi:iron complex outermembrane recepter protein
MRRTLALLVVLLSTAQAYGLAQTRPTDLAQLSIEDLMKIEITSASRKEQPVEDAAAAVFVITQEDIRRSGMTTLPDVLRLAPGVDVAQINSNKWAVSVRGFNGFRTNKLLVLVDGRSVYNRIFSGVLWDTEDVVLDDVERIEIIRGPGAAMWGANAVNGVINVITKTAAASQGGLVRVDGGRDGHQGLARYGGTIGDAQYRVYSQWTHREDSLLAPGTRANDGSHSTTTGFRADWKRAPDAFILEGSFTAGQQRALFANLDPQTSAAVPISDVPSDSQGAVVVGRWTHTRPSGDTFQAQSSLDVASRQEPILDYTRRSFDATTQYNLALGRRHDIVAGAGYRFVRETVHGHDGLSLVPPDNNSHLATGFLQDEIALAGGRLAVTLGSQAQYDSHSGAGVQPTARAMWKGWPRQRLWAATSRALRTPSLQERGIRASLAPVPSGTGLPLFVTVAGNPAVKTETFGDAEAGYRIEIGANAAVDVTGFAGRYHHLRTVEQMAPPAVQFAPFPHLLLPTQYDSLLDASTHGLEVSGQWAPIPAWRLGGSYTNFHATYELAASSHDIGTAVSQANAPRHQGRLYSTLLAGSRATIHVALFPVGPIERLGVSSYTRADVNVEWRVTRRLSVTAIAQNLLDPSHAEFSNAESWALATRVPRSGGLKARWTF